MIETKQVVTAYDVRLTTEQCCVLFTFLDMMLPVNAAMPVAEPGERRQRLSDEELQTVNEVRTAMFRIYHG